MLKSFRAAASEILITAADTHWKNERWNGHQRRLTLSGRDGSMILPLRRVVAGRIFMPFLP